MIEISITATRRRWWGLQKRTWRRQLPQSWADVRQRRRHSLFSMQLIYKDAGITAALKSILNLPAWAWANIDPEDLAAIHQHMGWMRPAVTSEVLPFPSFWHRGEEYFFPYPKFENGTCLEFVLADSYYKKYSDTLDEAHLVRLVATLCRPAAQKKESALLSGDIRQALHTKEEVEAIAIKLNGLDPVYRSLVLLYFIGVKEYVNRTYWMLFRGGESSEEEESAPAAGPKFGWWSKFMEVAECGLFGNYDQVLQKRLHLICMYLVDQQSKSDRAAVNMAAQRAKIMNDDSTSA